MDIKNDPTHEHYNIDEELLCELADEPKWTAAYDFYMNVKDKDYDDLSTAQVDWLHKIERDLEDESNEFF